MNIKELPKIMVIIESKKMEKLFSVFLSIYHEYIDVSDIRVNDAIIDEFNELYQVTTEYLDETFHAYDDEYDVYNECPEFIDFNMFRTFVELYPIDDFHLTGLDVSSALLYDRHGTTIINGDKI